jgi:hypothetical protein
MGMMPKGRGNGGELGGPSEREARERLEAEGYNQLPRKGRRGLLFLRGLFHSLDPPPVCGASERRVVRGDEARPEADDSARTKVAVPGVAEALVHMEPDEGDPRAAKLN